MIWKVEGSAAMFSQLRFGCRGWGILTGGGLVKVTPGREEDTPKASETSTLQISPVSRMRALTQKNGVPSHFARVSVTLFKALISSVSSTKFSVMGRLISLEIFQNFKYTIPTTEMILLFLFRFYSFFAHQANFCLRIHLTR